MSTFGGIGNGIKNPFKFSADSIPDLSNRVILVTGANAGVGKESVLQFSKHNPKRLYLAARSQAKFDVALKDIRAKVPDAKIDFLELDLGSFESVKKAAEKVLAENDRLDILMNNAGIMGAPAARTASGYETHFGTNFMGHALLTRLLLPLLEKTAALPGADVRIVNLSSSGQQMAPAKAIPFDETQTDGSSRHPYVWYGIANLSKVLHAQALAKRYPNITSVSVHPGRVGTTLLNDYFKKGSGVAYFQRAYDYIIKPMTVEDGALSQLWGAAGKKENVKNGGYYTPVGYEGSTHKLAKDPKVAEQLWKWQDEEFSKLGY